MVQPLIGKLSNFEKMKDKNARRYLLIVGGILLFCGLLSFSVLKVRFPVAAGEKSEFAVIEYSLTDSIKRGQDGTFVVTPGQVSRAGEPAKPCPT